MHMEKINKNAKIKNHVLLVNRVLKYACYENLIPRAQVQLKPFQKKTDKILRIKNKIIILNHTMHSFQDRK